jgi:hypothetical protein
MVTPGSGHTIALALFVQNVLKNVIAKRVAVEGGDKTIRQLWAVRKEPMMRLFLILFSVWHL